MKQPVTPLKKPRINRWGFFLDVPGMPASGRGLPLNSGFLRVSEIRVSVKAAVQPSRMSAYRPKPAIWVESGERPLPSP